MIYRITRQYYKNLSEKRDSRGRIVERFNKGQVIEYLNSICGFKGLIERLDIQ